VRLRLDCSDCASANRSENLLAAEIGKIQERLSRNRRQGVAQTIDVAFIQNVRGQQAQHIRVAAVPVRMFLSINAACTSLRGRES